MTLKISAILFEFGYVDMLKYPALIDYVGAVAELFDNVEVVRGEKNEISLRRMLLEELL